MSGDSGCAGSIRPRQLGRFYISPNLSLTSGSRSSPRVSEKWPLWQVRAATEAVLPYISTEWNGNCFQLCGAADNQAEGLE